MELAPGEISEVLDSVLQMSRRRAAEKEIEVTLECEENLRAPINGTLLEQAILNLVNNAVKLQPAEKLYTNHGPKETATMF